MNDHVDLAEARVHADVRQRALAHARARTSRAPSGLRIGAIAAAILLHLFAASFLYLLMRARAVLDQDRIEVRLLDAVPVEPALPEPPPLPPKAPPPTAAKSPPARTPAAPVRTQPAAQAEADAPPKSIDTATLFRADGSIRLPPPGAAPKAAPHEENIERGRALMARGLDCDVHAPDDLAHRESLGEEVARKYLSWVGLYNPAAAQHRAEQEEKRQTRCRMWKGAGP